jgi:hypothetical protein
MTVSSASASTAAVPTSRRRTAHETLSTRGSDGNTERGGNHLMLLVEPRGIEPLTFALRTRRSPS